MHTPTSSRKILIVSETVTHPTTAGNRMCQLAYCQLLEKMGYEVYFLYVRNDYGTEAELEATRRYWKDRFFYYAKSPLGKYRKFLLNLCRIHLSGGRWKVDDYAVPGLTRYISRLHREQGFHGIIVNYVWLSGLLPSLSIPVKALFTHDVFSFRNRRIGDKSVYTLTPDEEAKGLQRSPHILAIQQNEAIYYRYLAPNSRIFTVYSPFEYTPQPVQGNKHILFLSGPNAFNLEGIGCFIREVMPLLAERDPEIKLLIGGGICRRITGDLLRPYVELAGEVDSIDDFYRRADVAVNPVFQGTGLKIKTFESISRGKATVAHPHSAEGIFAPAQAPLLLAANAAEYADKLLSLIGNKEALLANQQQCKHYLEQMNLYIQEQYRQLFEETPATR